MIKSTGIIRKVDTLGRIILPTETRNTLGIGKEDELEILIDYEKGQIVLQKGSKVCLKCQSVDGLKEIKPGFYICDMCIQKLK